MDPAFLEEAIIDRLAKGTKPKAIIPVHLYGMPARMDEIIAIAKKYEIPIIEDAAEALGSSINNKKCGTFGEIGILSFNGNKIITTSGGGALVSKNSEYIKEATFLATQARDAAPHYQHSKIGYNYRLSNICAGIGRGQMKVLPQRIDQRRANFFFYRNELSDLSGISFLEEPEDFYSNRWLTTILIDPNMGASREEIRLRLEQENIESRPLWKPMHLQPVFKGFPFYGRGISQELFEGGLCLPSGSNLAETDLERVVNCVQKVYRK
jgi:dTDP-4-amino-4,6-dideoxygalactose transaminase